MLYVTEARGELEKAAECPELIKPATELGAP